MGDIDGIVDIIVGVKKHRLIVARGDSTVTHGTIGIGDFLVVGRITANSDGVVLNVIAQETEDTILNGLGCGGSVLVTVLPFR